MEMPYRLTALRGTIAKLLPGVDGVLALHSGPSGMIAPYLFVKDRPEELADLAVWPRWFIPEALEVILRTHPDARLGIVCRACEERNIVEVFLRAHLNMDRVAVITLHCRQREAQFCQNAIASTNPNLALDCPASHWLFQSIGEEMSNPPPAWKTRMN